MKPAVILEWVKKNLVSVICVAVAVVALPVMYVLGSGWAGKQRLRVENEIKKHQGDLASLKVDYTVEPVIPSEKGFTFSAPPNAATTAQMKELLTKTGEQVGGIKARVVEFNRDGKKPLIEGLFPKPESAIDEPAMTDAMAKGVVPAMADLIRKHGGGGAPEREDVEQRMKDAQFREQQAAMAVRADGKLTPEDDAAIQKRLTGERLAVYTSRAQEIRFYAVPSAFAFDMPKDDKTAPTMEQAWEWQWLLWAYEDVVRAVARANEGQSLLVGPVKHIVSARVEPMARASQALADDPTAATPSDKTRTVTGRVGPNGLYDIRYVDLTLIVATEQIPAIIDALGATDLISVVGLEVESLSDEHERLQAGYVYTRGVEHVAKLALRLETVWLRDWTGALAPEGTKALLGFPGTTPPAAGEGEKPGGQGEAPAPTPGRGLRKGGVKQ